MRLLKYQVNVFFYIEFCKFFQFIWDISVFIEKNIRCFMVFGKIIVLMRLVKYNNVIIRRDKKKYLFYVVCVDIGKCLLYRC